MEQEKDRLHTAYELIDPYYYRHRLTMPKLILNAAGDQFFLPDSTRFYWNDLRGESYLRYVPNADHSLSGTDAMESLIAFHSLISNGTKPPQLTWNRAPDGTLQAMTDTDPLVVNLWQMTNPVARDFRVETQGPGYTNSPVPADQDGLYRAIVPAPESGWTAFFLEFTYDVGAATPLKLTTGVTVIPDMLPFADKPLDLPTSITMICTAANEQSANLIAGEVVRNLEDAEFATNAQTHVSGERLYINWQPAGSNLCRGPGNAGVSADPGMRSVQLSTGIRTRDHPGADLGKVTRASVNPDEPAVPPSRAATATRPTDPDRKTARREKRR